MASNESTITITNDSCENYCNSQPPPPYSSVPGVVPLYSASSPSSPPAYEDVIDPEGDSSTNYLPKKAYYNLFILFYFLFINSPTSIL